jgi:hypothetical protein
VPFYRVRGAADIHDSDVSTRPLQRRRDLVGRSTKVRGFRALAGLLVIAALATGCVAPVRPGGAAVGPPRVLVYGDSLTWESARYIPEIATTEGLSVTEHSFPGTAICDWFRDMWVRIPAERPTVVVFAFFGNSWTNCMSDGLGGWLQGAAKVKKYDVDASAAATIALASGAKVVFLGAPRSRDQMHDPAWEGVRNDYRRVAQRHPQSVSFVDGGATIAPDDVYSDTQPCLPRERNLVESGGYRPCEHGRIIVRATDGLHFCPHGLDNAIGQPGHCPRYMSGGYRWITAMLDGAWRATRPRAAEFPPVIHYE